MTGIRRDLQGSADASCEQQKAIGKDEVPGPNPGSSSKKKFLIYVLSAKIRGFFVSKSSEIRKSKNPKNRAKPAFSNISNNSNKSG